MKAEEKQQLIYGGLCWVAFAVILLALVDGRTWVAALDRLGYQLTQPTTAGKTAIFRVLTRFGDPVNLQITTLFLMVFLWWRKKISDSLWYGALNFIGYTLVILVKYTIIRPRPSARLVKIGGYSFPSGHTFATTVFALTIVALLAPRLKRRWQRWLLTLVAVFFIILIMYSRVYLRAHYASDVTAGLLLAAGWWLIANAERHRCGEWLVKPIIGYFE